MVNSNIRLEELIKVFKINSLFDQYTFQQPEPTYIDTNLFSNNSDKGRNFAAFKKLNKNNKAFKERVN